MMLALTAVLAWLFCLTLFIVGKIIGQIAEKQEEEIGLKPIDESLRGQWVMKYLILQRSIAKLEDILDKVVITFVWSTVIAIALTIAHFALRVP